MRKYNTVLPTQKNHNIHPPAQREKNKATLVGLNLAQ